MKKILLFLVAVSVITAGCSKEEDELPQANPGAVTAVDPLAQPGSNSSATPAVEAFDPNKVGPMLPMADFAAADRPAGNDGAAMQDLEYLNALLFRVNESRGSWSTDYVPNFKTEAEQQAYDAALKKLKEPITDLNELVRIKALKAIPPAPAGKKYGINSKTLKVELIDATATP